jgi:hypothetical protein
MIWAQEIQPILTKHFNSALRYKWFPEPAVITSDDLVAVWWKLLWHLLDAEEGGDPRWTEFEAYTPENNYDPEEFLPGVMMFLKAGMPDTERGVPIGDLKTLFFSYLRTVVDDGSLPVFLAYIDHERGGDVCETEQAGTSHEAPPLPIAADKNKWSFTLNGPVWDVTFNGEAGPVKDSIPVRRILPALEQPGVKFGYIQLVQMTSGPGGETQTENPDGLSIQTDGEGILTKRDLETWQLAANEQFKRYKENPEAEGDKWNQFKAALQSGGYYVIESEESVQVKKSKWKPDIDRQLKKAGGTVSKNRTEFLKKIQHIPKLHDHMERFLKMKNGLIYDPAKGSLAWKIIK